MEGYYLLQCDKENTLEKALTKVVNTVKHSNKKREPYMDTVRSGIKSGKLVMYMLTSKRKNAIPAAYILVEPSQDKRAARIHAVVANKIPKGCSRSAVEKNTINTLIFQGYDYAYLDFCLDNNKMCYFSTDNEFEIIGKYTDSGLYKVIVCAKKLKGGRVNNRVANKYAKQFFELYEEID